MARYCAWRAVVYLSASVRLPRGYRDSVGENLTSGGVRAREAHSPDEIADLRKQPAADAAATATQARICTMLSE